MAPVRRIGDGLSGRRAETVMAGRGIGHGAGGLAAVVAVFLSLGGAAAAETAVHTVTLGEVEDLKAVLATVESTRAPLVRTRIGGTLARIDVTEGDRVGEGQVIALVSDPKLPLQIAAFDARLAALAAKRDLLQTDLQRVRQLRATGAAPQARLDDVETQLVVTDAEIAAARAERAVVERQVKEGEVVSPAAGRVLRVQAVAGQVVMPGEAVAVVATGRYLLKLRLPERHARFVREGDPVRVAGRGLGVEAPLAAGRITRVYPELTEGQVVADAEADGIGDFFVGERARVYVATGKRPAFFVPKALVRDRAGVATVTLDGGLEVPVQTGETRGETIELLSGVAAGDRLVAPKETAR